MRIGALALARADEDDRIIRSVASLDEAMLDKFAGVQDDSRQAVPTGEI